MRMDQSFKDMESMFKRNFPNQTKGKDRAAIREIMREMGYGYGTGLNKKMRKSKGVSKFKDGGLAEAIEKVKAKEMEVGGDVPKPKMRPKKDPFRADKTESLDKEFSKKVAKQNEENKKKAKKMKAGGEVPAKFKGFSKLPEPVQEKMDPALAKKFGMGGDVKGKGGKMMCRGRGAAIKGGGFSIR